MLHVTFAGSHIILQTQGKVNRLAKETIKQNSNKYQESGGFIKKRRAREMKKRFQVTLYYEVDIDEKIRFSREVRQESLEKMQDILDALLSHQDILFEYYKACISTAIRDGHMYFGNFGQFIQVKEDNEIYSSLAENLPPELASYSRRLLWLTKVDDDIENDLEEERGLFFDHIGELIGVNASVKMIGYEDDAEAPEERECMKAGVLVIGQLLSNGEIVPLQGLRLQPCGFIREK